MRYGTANILAGLGYAWTMRPSGECCICGLIGPLSYEHVPPESAFNKSRVFIAHPATLFPSLAKVNHQGIKGRVNQRGAGGYTICEPCNNRAGRWYVRRYVEWAEQGMRYLLAQPKGYSLSLPFRIAPLPVIKQIICMFASACGPGLFNSSVELRKFVLDRTFNELHPRFQIYCSFMSHDSTMARQTGITGVLDASRGGLQTETFSEIAFPPYIYLLYIESKPSEWRMQNISFFASSNYHNVRQIHLNLYLNEINSAFPGDYRTTREIRVAAQRNRLLP